MFAVLQIADFALHALMRLNPALRGEAVAVLEGEGRRARIAQCSPGLSNVRLGMTATQALAECPALQLLSPSLAAEREAGALLLTAGWAIGPRVEATAAGVVTVDLQGVNLELLRGRVAQICRGMEREGLFLQAGIAPNPLSARFAAHQARPVCWVDDHQAFLRGLPIELLALSEAESRFFQALGLMTLGALSAFPRAALANRLGQRGELLWAQASGEYTRPITPAPLPTRHCAQMDLEEPVETLDPLLFVLRRFCERLATEVGQFGGGTARLSLGLHLEDDKQLNRDFDLPEPTANPDVLFGVLENHLSSLQTDAPIVSLFLEAHAARRLHTQEGLFDTGLKDAPLFYATLGRVAAIVGTENIGTPRHADSHRPDAYLLSAPAANVPERVPPAAAATTGPQLRRLRPPAPATVELTSARPSFLSSNLVVGDVNILRRPVWSNGDWWAAAWAREEWDVRIGPGLYRLLHAPDGWFIEGIYD